jgi:hypothetical protein
METQTRFDLDAAIANWQQELAAQADLTPIVRRELETHLRDTVAELQTRGLNNEESFWLARRRLGEPQLLREEFEKADPASVWRERVFWMCIALVTINLWGAFLNQFIQFSMTPSFVNERIEEILPGWLQFYLPYRLRDFQVYYALQFFLQLARFVPLVLMAFWLAKGRLNFGQSAFAYILSSRKRFLLAAFSALLIANSRSFLDPDFGRLSAMFFFQFPWTFSLVSLAAWLIPAKKEVVARI